MMLQIMAYTVAVTAALTVVGFCAERFAGLHRFTRRTAWVAIMVLSVLFPLAMLFNPRAPVHEANSPAAVSGPAQDALPSALLAPVEQKPIWEVAAPSDSQVLAMWAAASLSVTVYLLAAGLLLRLRAARWRRRTVLGHDVLVSEVTGPALLGVLKPRIVVPRWMLEQPVATQSLILEHERQHMAARDPLLVVAGLFIIAAVPWNPLLWWQWRRMRHAMEMDCDTRVLRMGAEPGTYAEVLLEVTRRATRIFPGALAMSEPVGALEQRIDNLEPGPTRYARARSVALLGLAAMSAGVALAMEAPPLPQAPATQTSDAAASVVIKPPEQRGSSPEAMIATNDHNKDGIVTIEEAALVNGYLYIMWHSHYDLDHDGRVDVAELTRANKERAVGTALTKLTGSSGGRPANADPEAIISSNDLNGDGIVTKEEAVTVNREFPKSLRGQLLKIWGLYDLNHDDKLELEEVRKASGY